MHVFALFQTMLLGLKTFDEQIGSSLLCLLERADLSRDEKW